MGWSCGATLGIEFRLVNKKHESWSCTDNFRDSVTLQNLDAAGAKALADSISAMDVSGCDVSIALWPCAASHGGDTPEIFSSLAVHENTKEGDAGRRAWHWNLQGYPISAGQHLAHLTIRRAVLPGARPPDTMFCAMGCYISPESRGRW